METTAVQPEETMNDHPCECEQRAANAYRWYMAGTILSAVFIFLLILFIIKKLFA